MSDAPTLPSQRALKALPRKDLVAATAAANVAYAEADLAYTAACQRLGEALTEQVVRRVVEECPRAHRLRVVAVTDTIDTVVVGRPITRLVVDAIVDEHGHPAGCLQPHSPIPYWIERLTHVLGVGSWTLTIPTRAWDETPRGNGPDGGTALAVAA